MVMHSLTDCLERYTSRLPTPRFKEQIWEGKCGCNGAARYFCATENEQEDQQHDHMFVSPLHQVTQISQITNKAASAMQIEKKMKKLSMNIKMIAVKDTQNLDTLVFFFSSLTAFEASVLVWYIY